MKHLINTAYFIMHLLASQLLHAQPGSVKEPAQAATFSGKPSGIIRMLDDSTGIGRIVNDKVVIDNLDTMNFVFRYKEENITCVMFNFRVDNVKNHYYLISEGINHNKKIGMALPCFIDYTNGHNSQPPGLLNESHFWRGEATNRVYFSRDAEGCIDGVKSANHTVISWGGKAYYRSFVINLDKYRM